MSCLQLVQGEFFLSYSLPDEHTVLYNCTMLGEGRQDLFRIKRLHAFTG